MSLGWQAQANEKLMDLNGVPGVFFLVCGPMAREPCGKIGSGVIMRAVGGCS